MGSSVPLACQQDRRGPLPLPGTRWVTVSTMLVAKSSKTFPKPNVQSSSSRTVFWRNSVSPEGDHWATQWAQIMSLQTYVTVTLVNQVKKSRNLKASPPMGVQLLRHSDDQSLMSREHPVLDVGTDVHLAFPRAGPSVVSGPETATMPRRKNHQPRHNKDTKQWRCDRGVVWAARGVHDHLGVFEG